MSPQLKRPRGINVALSPDLQHKLTAFIDAEELRTGIRISVQDVARAAIAKFLEPTSVHVGQLKFSADVSMTANADVVPGEHDDTA